MRILGSAQANIGDALPFFTAILVAEPVERKLAIYAIDRAVIPNQYEISEKNNIE